MHIAVRLVSSLLLFVVLAQANFAAAPLRGAEPQAGPAMRAQAYQSLKDGNFDVAYVALRRLTLDPQADPQRVGEDLASAVQCLNNLGRIAEFDAFVEAAVAVHGGNWRLLRAAAHAYLTVEHNGHLIAGEFHRGGQQGGGRAVNADERDRVAALRLMVRAIPAIRQENDKGAVADFYLSLARNLLADRGHVEAWRLQTLTDLEKLPDYDEGFYYGFEYHGAPVDAEGRPVFHRASKTWETAADDGQRWRWALDQVVENQPSRRDEVRRELAEFFQQQFDVTTIAEPRWAPYFAGEQADEARTDDTNKDDETKKDESGVYAVHTLKDDETIARLANGVKRFTLPDEFNFLKIYQQLEDHEQLARIFENRRQLARAAAEWKKVVEQRTGDAAAARKEIDRVLAGKVRGNDDDALLRYRQIVGAWGQFQAAATQPAGAGATVAYRFRNGKRVRFEAFAVDEAKLLDDLKAYLKSSPKELDWNRLELGDIGARLLENDRQKYVGAKVASWSLDLQPRDDHWDRRVSVTTPLQKAGAYWVVARLDGGNESRIVLWVADTAIVQKRLADRELYFVADAVSGRPVAGANLEFFGYRVEQAARNRQQIVTANFAERTDADGLATPDPRDLTQETAWMIVARTPQGRLAHLGFQHVWHSPEHQEPDRGVKIFGITDRPVYRPKQKVQFKFWVRQTQYDQDDRPQFVGVPLNVEIHDARGEKVWAKTFTTDAYGGAAGEWELPADASLGAYMCQASIAPRNPTQSFSGGVSFRAEEYKKPEFEVTVEAPKRPVQLGEKIVAKIQARYYFGSPVVNATVKYKVTRVPHHDRWYPRMPWDWCYGPGYWWFGYDYDWYPGWDRWVGCRRPLPPWWPGGSNEPPELVAQVERPIGPDGSLEVEIDTLIARQLHGDSDHQYSITAEVRDESRRTIVGSGDVLVARKPFQVFCWVDRGYYREGDSIQADFLAQTLDHQPVAGQGELTLLRVTYDAERRPIETPVQNWKLEVDAQGRASQKIQATAAGQYRLSLRVTDSQRRTIEGGYLFTIVDAAGGAGGSGPGGDGRAFRFNALELIPDKREYQPGDTVRLQINTDQIDSTVLLFVRPAGGVYLPPRMLRLKGKTTTVDVAVVKGDMPNFFIEAVTVAGARAHLETKEIVVPPEKRVLNVEVLPSAKEYLPGQDAKIRVRVTDFHGENYVGSLVASVYDRSVEYVSGGSNVPDIKEFFWKWRRSHEPNQESSLDRGTSPAFKPDEPTMQPIGVFAELDFESTLVTRPFFFHDRRAMGGMGGGGMMRYAPMAAAGAPMMMAQAAKAAPGFAAADMNAPEGAAVAGAMGGAGGGGAVVQPTVRTNFADTALWVGAATTDRTGVAEFSLKMPESLTAWKIKVWSLGHGTRVGSGEAETVTRKNLLVRAQTPRFFVEKDEVVLSANVHNYLKKAKDVAVVLELAGGTAASATAAADTAAAPLLPLGPLTQTISIPAGGERRVDWRVRVASEGEAVVRMKALTDEESDAVELKLPAYVHGMLKTQAWAGTVRPDKDSARLTLHVPAERRPEQTTLELRFSPSLAGAMLDALPYLADYPYGCTEQTLHRFLPSVVTQKVLREIGVNLADLQAQRTNLNAQQLGDAAERAKQWKQLDRGGVFDQAELDRMVKQGLTALAEMQCADGGWGWFAGANERSGPHTTAVVVHGLQIARQNDLPLVPGLLERGVAWLQRHQAEQVRQLQNAATKTKPWKTSADNLDAMIYALLVDAGLDDESQKEAQKAAGHAEMRDLLYRDRVQLSVYAKAMFGLALHKIGDQQKLAMIVRNVEQFLVQDDENETAYLRLPESNFWWFWYGGEIEANAWYLKLLARVDPRGKTAPRLVKYLLNNRRHGVYWNSTRDTAYCVEAMADYLRASGEQKPDMTVEVWFDGRKRKETRITAENLFTFDNRFVLSGADVPTGDRELEIRRRGAGPLYFNAYLTNFTREERIERAGLEVKVDRKFYRLKPVDAEIQTAGARGQAVAQKREKYERQPLADLAQLKSGELVEVELEIESKNDYEYLLFEDMKAAGFEPVDVRSGYSSNGLGAYMELRDNRVSFFVRWLARGKHSVSYRLRAETPGRFSALPTRASAMYAPELRGNSDELRLRIED